MVTSATPFRGLANYSMYATGRGAGAAMVKSLSLELAPSNIQINAIAPNYPESNLLPALVDRERSGDGQDARQYSGETFGSARRSRRIDRVFRVGQMRVRDGTRGPYLRRLGLVGGNFGEASKLGSFGAFVCISGALVARLRNNKGG